MAWSSPRTWTTGELVTAAIMNTHVRDNFNQTAPALVTTKGDLVIATAANALARFPVSANNDSYPVADSAASTGWNWSQRADAGNNVSATLQNSDNTNTGSSARQRILVGGTSGGDPYIYLQVTGGADWALGIDNSDSDIFKITAGATVGANTFAINTAGAVFINDNSNAGTTVGLTINQAASDDEILSLKSSDVAHGMTSQTETDTFGYMAKFSATAGGLFIRGLSEVSNGLTLEGDHTTDDTTKGNAAVGAVQIIGALKSGSSITSIGANANILVVRNGYATGTRFILDADGDSHQDVGTAWTNFDAHDDAALLTALSVHVSRPGDVIRKSFRSFLRANRRKLEALKLVTFNRDGHHFVNMSRLTMLLVGAVRQQSGRIDRLVEALVAAGTPRALLKGV